MSSPCPQRVCVCACMLANACKLVCATAKIAESTTEKKKCRTKVHRGLERTQRAYNRSSHDHQLETKYRTEKKKKWIRQQNVHCVAFSGSLSHRFPTSRLLSDELMVIMCVCTPCMNGISNCLNRMGETEKQSRLRLSAQNRKNGTRMDITHPKRIQSVADCRRAHVRMNGMPCQQREKKTRSRNNNND